MDPAIVGRFNIGSEILTKADGGTISYPFWRVGVYTKNWSFLERLPEHGGQAIEVVHRKLTYGALDSVTGWPTEHYSDNDITGVMHPKGSTITLQSPGYYVRQDKAFATLDPIGPMDQIKHESKFYNVETSQHYLDLEVGGGAYWIADLKLLTMYRLRSPVGRRSGASVSSTDARAGLKTYWEKYITDANLPDEENNVLEKHVCYARPPRLIKEVLLGTYNKDVVLAIATPDPGEALLNYDQTPYRYKHRVSTTVWAIDKLNFDGSYYVKGVNAVNTMLMEMRNVLANNPTGSQYSLETSRDISVDFGGERLYGVDCTINYKRSITA